MEGTRKTSLTRAAVTGAIILFLAVPSRGGEDPKKRIKETKSRIEVAIAECEAAQKAEKPAPVKTLRAELRSLAADAEGLKALATYVDHRLGSVAILAVRAIGQAPAELKLYAGKLLAARVDARYLTKERRLVYIETVKELGRTGYLDAGPTLLKVLRRTKDSTVCHAIVEAIGRLGDARAIRTLFDRLSTGTSANLRGKDAGGGRRSRNMNPRYRAGADGKSQHARVGFDGSFLDKVEMDCQPQDARAVTNKVYEVLSELLGDEFGDWKSVDDFLRENKKEVEKKVVTAEKQSREQKREIARLLKKGSK